MKRRLRSCLLILIPLIFAGFSTANAQTNIRGAVLQDGTKERIEQVEVRNLRTGLRVHSDKFGLFNLNCNVGDTLLMERIGYQTQKVAINNSSDMLIRLKITNQLKEVAITGKRASEQFREVGRAYSKEKGIFYGGKPPISLLSPFGGSPLTFIHELFSKDGRRIRRLNQLAKKAAEDEEAARYFNDMIIQQTVAIDSSRLEDFKLKYTPKLDQLKKWSAYDRAKYIQSSFEDFRKKHDTADKRIEHEKKLILKNF